MAGLRNITKGYSGRAFLSHGFRPFFLLAGVWAALALPVWLWLYREAPSAPVSPLSWHAHEMLFGYLGAVLTGFLFTAIPNWTGRLPLAGARLAALALLWVAGRLVVWFFPGSLSLNLVLEASFLVIVAAAAWREVAAGRNWRNAPVCVMVSLFALANLAFHLEGALALPPMLGTRLGLAVAGVLIALIGGRIVPSFTTNWALQRKLEPLPAPVSRFDLASVAVVALALFSWAVFPYALWAGTLLMVAGAWQLIRLVRWRGWIGAPEPLVWVLHLGFLWLPIALALLGAAALWPAEFNPASGLHALSAGAIGLMTLAVMTRAALGHTGRARTADAATTAGYLLVFFGAVWRVAAAYLPLDYGVSITASGVLWSLGFAVFAVRYVPVLLGERR